VDRDCNHREGESMSAFRFLNVTERGGVVTCTMSNPPTHTLVAGEVTELDQLIDSLEKRDDVRVVVFTGAGEGVFIAHYEVGELAVSAERSSAQPKREPSSAAPGLHPFHRFILRMQRASFITIAAINGRTAGGGLEFALGCDFRLAMAGEFRIGLPEASVGIIPGAGGTQRFARLLGTAKALDLILHAQTVSPADALTLGLVHRVFDAAAFAQSVNEFAIDLASRAPIALAAAKRAIYEGSELPLVEGLLVEQREFDRCMASRDAATAMRNLLNGKPLGQWQGR
jgi:enoyl-CoA hydratase/carnithine racemase